MDVASENPPKEFLPVTGDVAFYYDINPQLEPKLQSFPSTIFHGYGMTETLNQVVLWDVSGRQRSRIYEALKGISLCLAL